MDRIVYEVFKGERSVLATFNKREAEETARNCGGEVGTPQVLTDSNADLVRETALAKLNPLELLVILMPKPRVRGPKQPEQPEMRVWDHTEGNRG